MAMVVQTMATMAAKIVSRARVYFHIYVTKERQFC